MRRMRSKAAPLHEQLRNLPLKLDTSDMNFKLELSREVHRLLMTTDEAVVVWPWSVGGESTEEGDWMAALERAQPNTFLCPLEPGARLTLVDPEPAALASLRAGSPPGRHERLSAASDADGVLLYGRFAGTGGPTETGFFPLARVQRGVRPEPLPLAAVRECAKQLGVQGLTQAGSGATESAEYIIKMMVDHLCKATKGTKGTTWWPWCGTKATKATKGTDQRSLEQLERTKKQQRNTKELGLQKRERGCARILCSFSGTVVPTLCCSGQSGSSVWRACWKVLNSAQMVLSLGFFWWVRLGVIGKIPGGNGIPWQESDVPSVKNIGVLGGFLSFFLVFFASQSYSRFMEQYKCSMSCEGRIFDVCSVAQACLSPGAAHRLWRHVNAAHALAYIGLDATDLYSVSSLLKPLQRQHHLLTNEEWRLFVTDVADDESGRISGGQAYRQLIAWAVHDVEACREKHDASNDWSPRQVHDWLLDLQELSAEDDVKRRIAELLLERRVSGAQLLGFAEDQQTSERDELTELLTEALQEEGEGDLQQILAWAGDWALQYRVLFETAQMTSVPLLRSIARSGRLAPILRELGVGRLVDRERLIQALCAPPWHEHAHLYARELRREIEKLSWGAKGELSDMRADELVRHVLRLRGALGSLYDYKDQPVPFFYVHLLYLISFVYLPLFAFDNALEFGHTSAPCGQTGSGVIHSDAELNFDPPCDEMVRQWLWASCTSTIVIVLQNIIVIGLTRICEMLADPYGNDVADLPVKHYVSFALTASKKILRVADYRARVETAQAPPAALEEHEVELQKLGIFTAIGDVFRHDTDAADAGSDGPPDGLVGEAAQRYFDGVGSGAPSSRRGRRLQAWGTDTTPISAPASASQAFAHQGMHEVETLDSVESLVFDDDDI
jgi:hypothetical protein